MHKVVDLYTDFLVACPCQASATMMSEVLDGALSHDSITRMLSSFKLDSSTLWRQVKPLCHEVSSWRSVAVLVIDDTIIAKPHTKVNGLVSYHFDHKEGRALKGINMVSALYHSQDMSIPVGAAFVYKDKPVIDKSGKEKLKATITKNEHFRHLVAASHININFDYVLADSWYANKENMRFVVEHEHTHFIMAMKENRRVALSSEDKKEGRYGSIRELAPEGDVRTVWIEGVDFPLLITRQVFKNEDGSCGVLYLASSDVALSAAELTAIYQRRWKVEEYHKSVKGVSSIGASPAWKVHTQKAHLYGSLIAFAKVEVLKQRHHKNHFALKAVMLKKATQASWKALDGLWLTTAQHKPKKAA